MIGKIICIRIDFDLSFFLLVFHLIAPQTAIWKLDFGREEPYNPVFAATVVPQVIYVPELNRLVPTFRCHIQIQDPVNIANQDFENQLIQSFELQIGSKFYCATSFQLFSHSAFKDLH